MSIPGDSLEARLVALAEAMEYPPTPDIAGAVARRLEREPVPTFGRRWPQPRLRFALGLSLLVLAVLGLIAAIGFAVGGLRLTPAPADPSLSVGGRGFGERVSLEVARERADFMVRVPTLDGLGDADRVYVATPPAGGQVSLVYGARPGYPVDPESGVGLVVTAFRADIGPETFEKLVSLDIRVEAVTVRDRPAWWIAGGDHVIVYRDADGDLVESSVRMVGDTLVWEEEGVTYRVEGAPSLEAAAAVAESLR
ncbi:MAG TPA: hypothetical protein VHQ42_04300 [Candidatus Limnocylindria bacterium]|nr:hypothetical protein [Candidatus Limnocylindria bacterium]